VQIHSCDALISEKESVILEVSVCSWFFTEHFNSVFIVKVLRRMQLTLCDLLQRSRQVDELKAALEEYSAITEVSVLSCNASLFQHIKN